MESIGLRFRLVQLKALISVLLPAMGSVRMASASLASLIEWIISCPI